MYTRCLGTAAAVGVLLLAGPARAADADQIERAVQRGVAFLKSQQGREGRWNYPSHEAGATALAGLALLECGVAADDPAIAAAARAVRQEVPRLTQTYDVALSVLFLDRLGDAADEPLLESLTVRLLAGQTPRGHWGYMCPQLGDEEVKRLMAAVNKANAGNLREQPKDKPRGPRGFDNVAPEVQKQVQQINQGALPFGPGPAAGGPPPGMDPSGNGDNSNTQFAIIGLWVGRRHGLPVGKALARAEAFFRATQTNTGGWGYMPPVPVAGGPPVGMMPGMGDGTPAMTCAGLLGLALGFGVAKEAADEKNDGKGKGKPAAPVDLGKDQAVKAALVALGTSIGQPVGNVGPGALPQLAAGANSKGYYFLWSLERVAVTYNLETVGNKDWYGWGSEIIIANHGNDGSWSAEYGQGGVDTSFALLFLRRANLVRDLSATLKGILKDPTQAELLGGGVGGNAFLKKIGLKPAFDNGAKPDKKPGKEGDKPDGPGKTAAAPKRRAEGEAAKLSDEVIDAPAGRQEALLKKLSDSKGSVYTDALADVIPRLEGKTKSKARELFADRLTRMTSETLKDKLEDDDPEVRGAAALAVAQKVKPDKAVFPRIVQMLDDEEVYPARAAHAALKTISGKDDGPYPKTKEERARFLAKWKQWLATQSP